MSEQPKSPCEGCTEAMLCSGSCWDLKQWQEMIWNWDRDNDPCR